MDDDGFVALIVFGGAVYFAWQYFRQRNTRTGQIFFSPSPPNQRFRSIDRSVNVLIPMQLSANGEAFIKHQEGLRLSRYIDAGHWAIGYGHDIRPGENIGQTITQAQADALFEQDVSAVENDINSLVKVELNQNQFDALVDFVYNVGTTHFASSTLLTILNQGNYAGAAQQLMRWIFSEGQRNQSLIDRRTAEQNLFNGSTAGV